MNRALLEKLLQRTDSALPIPLAKSSSPKAIVIDLNDKSLNSVEVSQLYLNKYVGGPALAARLWACFSGLSDENAIVITGSEAGSLITVCFKSPVTERLTFNTFPGKLKGNCCVIAVVGQLDSLGIVNVNENNIEVISDADLNAKNAVQLGTIFPGCIATGKAADLRVSYSCAVCCSNPTGRGGLGLVMSDKNLKAMNLGIIPTNRDTFDTSSFVRSASILGWAPVDNISKRTDPRLYHLCTAEKNRILGNVSIPCQAVLMLGSNVGCFDISRVYSRYVYCLENGLDPVSAGNVLGLIKESKIVDIDFSDNSEVFALLDSIMRREGTVGIFADGVRASSSLIKDKTMAKQINGLECGPYDYRGTLASVINDAFGNWFPVYFDLVPGLKIKDKVKLAMYNEELVMGLQCMNINPDVIVPLMIDKISSLKKFLLNHGIIPIEKMFETEDLNITDIFTVGQNCREIVRTINKVLNDDKKYIPDFFCIDPESNASDDTIVDAKNLINSYQKYLEDF